MASGAEDILNDHAIEQGWNEHSQISLLCAYIDNQKDNHALEEFLDRKADEENAA